MYNAAWDTLLKDWQRLLFHNLTHSGPPGPTSNHTGAAVIARRMRLVFNPIHAEGIRGDSQIFESGVEIDGAWDERR